MQGSLIGAVGRRALLWSVLVVAGICLVVPALADPKTERDATALQKRAVEEDFLNLDYAGAIKKLSTAIAKCGGSKCGGPVKAALLRDLGAMQILAGNEGEGRGSFGQAIALDGALDLDPAYKNPQLEAIWADAKKKAGGGGGGGGGGAPGPQPSGDFAHTPPTEGPVRTPLPVFAEYTGSEELARVILKYQGASMGDWKSLQLSKLDTGFGGLIPCKDVTPGTMSYYIQGFNAGNDPVATSGSRTKPYTVAIKNEIHGPAPSLPGQDPPKQCGELAGAECPPDFPGCNNKKGAGEDCDKPKDCQSNSCVGGKCSEKKAGGDDCAKDDECASGSCSDDKCTAAKKGPGDNCENDDECDSGSCKDNKCVGDHTPVKGKRLWIGVSVSLDFYAMPGANDVCILTKGLINTAGYGCVNPSNNQTFPDQNSFNLVVPGHSDQVQGGFAHGPLALMLSFDYALTPNILIGGRAGYELFTDPALHVFAPVHIEGRFTYLFGNDALTKVAPMFIGGLGVGEFDGSVPVSVFTYTTAPTTQKPSPSQTGPYKMQAWLNAGPFFAAVGGGVRVPLGPSVALTAAVKLQSAFSQLPPHALFGVSPEAGLQFGL